jgi:hypothetical protein
MAQVFMGRRSSGSSFFFLYASLSTVFGAEGGGGAGGFQLMEGTRGRGGSTPWRERAACGREMAAADERGGSTRKTIGSCES